MPYECRAYVVLQYAASGPIILLPPDHGDRIPHTPPPLLLYVMHPPPEGTLFESTRIDVRDCLFTPA